MKGCFLVIDNLSFSYRKHPVFSNVTFEVEEGVTVLLGPNGAGKSTLFKCITGALRPTSGNIQIPEQYKIGYVPQSSEMPAGAKVIQVLNYAAWLCGKNGDSQEQSVKQVIDTLSLEKLLKRRVRTLSGGERQRVALAVGIIDNPRLLLLDEPTVGLDPSHRYHLRQTISELSKNRCILLSTHLIEDVTQIAQRIVLLSGGTSFFAGSVSDFVHQFTGENSVTSTAIERAYDQAVNDSLKASAV